MKSLYENNSKRLKNAIFSKFSRDNLMLKVKAELLKRMDKGYNVDLSKIDEEIDNFLKEQNVG